MRKRRTNVTEEGKTADRLGSGWFSKPVFAELRNNSEMQDEWERLSPLWSHALHVLEINEERRQISILLECAATPRGTLE
jgi:hypothetical protein